MNRTQAAGLASRLAAGSRRTVLSRWLCVLLATLPVTVPRDEAAARKKRKRKQKRNTCSCGRCRACQGGACVPEADGADCGACGSCQGGACIPKVNQTLCGLCESCQAGDCVPKPLGSPCSSSGQCDGEECVFPPGCDGFATPCTSGGSCCSETCCEVLGVRYCCRGESGQQCQSDEDCVEGTRCVAYRCRA